MERELTSEHYVFQQYCFRETKRNDVTAGNGCHFVGYMRRGEGRLIGKDRELTVREGELFYIPAGYPYVSVWSGVPDVCFDSYGFSHFPVPQDVSYPLQKITPDEALLEALERLAARRVVDLCSVGNFCILLGRMLPRMQSQGTHAHRTVEAALDYMHAATELSVPALARHCRVSESGLYAAFRTARGCTPVGAWHRILVSRAEELLCSTDLSVEEIASRLGFCSASYFRKIFVRVTGQTPREVRKRARI